MCENDPPLKEPLCVQVCRVDALTYEERGSRRGRNEAGQDWDRVRISSGRIWIVEDNRYLYPNAKEGVKH